MRLNGAVSDKERAQLELKMLQNNFTSLEAKFKELKEEHERIINKAAKIESTGIYFIYIPISTRLIG